MRLIGQFHDEAYARRFGDLLYGQGIENHVDEASDGQWAIWVVDENRTGTARAVFDQFVQRPDDPAFGAAAEDAANRRARDAKQNAPGRARVVDARTIFYRPPVPYGLLTMTLIAISVIVTLITDFGKSSRFVRPLAITQYWEMGDHIRWETALPEIRHGQVWRLFTPMFLHFDILHILFNMLWLRDLGSLIEARKGRWLLLLLVSVIAAISNVAQYVVGGPAFGGMSGVVYGLLGYAWMQGRFNPASELSLQPQTVTLMIIWFFLCLTGWMGQVANTAHGAGAVVGIAWGYLTARWAIRRHSDGYDRE